MHNRCGYTSLFTNGQGTAIAHGKATFCVTTFSKMKLLGGNFHGCVKKTKKKKEKEKEKEKENNNNKKQRNKHKIYMTVPGVKCQGWKERDNRSKLCSLGGPVSTLARILECEIYLISFWLE